MQLDRPKFLPSFLELLRQEAEESSWVAILPYGGIACAAIGAAVSYLIPNGFWDRDQLAVSTVVFTGIMTLDGLILALGWNAFGRVYDKLFGGEFGTYLSEKNLLNNYLVHIAVQHWSQVVAVLISGVALVMVLIENVPLVVQRVTFALVIITTAYAIKQAVAAIKMMNDLAWQANVFEAWRAKERNGSSLRSVPGGRS